MQAQVTKDVTDGNEIIAKSGEVVELLDIIDETNYLAENNNGTIWFALSINECHIIQPAATGN